MPDKNDNQLEINMNGRRKVDQLYRGIPAPFVVKTGMDAVNLELGPKQRPVWLSDDAIRGFNFRGKQTR